MDWLCIPGWATTPDMFTNVMPEKSSFKTVDFNFFNDLAYPGELQANVQGIVCFSLGSLAALQLTTKIKIKKIVFLGGFTYFPGMQEKSARRRQMKINLMIREMKKNPLKVLNDFYQEAGLPAKKMTKMNTINLIHGLELLRDCDMSHVLAVTNSEVVTIHAKEDKIIPLEIHNKQFMSGKHFLIEGNHGTFLSNPDKVKQILREVVNEPVE